MLVEIKARFDEEANIRWARKLEQAGCHVVYGLVGPQDPLQARDGRPRRARRHPSLHPHRHRQLQLQDRARCTRTSASSPPTSGSARTSRTCSTTFSGWSRNAAYDQLLVAPDHVRSGLLDRIHREIEHQRAGRPARIRMKMNSLVDEQVIDALYLASTRGRAPCS